MVGQDRKSQRESNRLGQCIETSQTHLLLTARVHSTIFMFCVGLFLAYSMQIYSTIESLKDTIFQESKRIYQVEVPFQCGMPGFYSTIYDSEDTNEPAAASLSSDGSAERPAATWECLLTEFLNLAIDRAPLKSPESRGQRMCDILIELLNHYPFPEFRRGNRVNLPFATVAEIDAWQKDISTVRNVVLNATRTVHSEDVEAAIDAYSSNWMKDELARLSHAGANADTIDGIYWSSAPKVVFERLCNVLVRTEEIVEPVRNHLTELAFAKQRYPAKKWFIGVALSCFIFFATAVMTPIYICVRRDRVRKWVYELVSLWLPSVFYAGLFVFLFSRLLR